MSADDEMGVDELAALAKQIDLPSPDEPRVELMRASLLRAAAEERHEPRARWPFVVGGFSAGAAAAAATALVVLHASHPAAVEPRAQIEASTAADFDRTITHDAYGTDEAVRLHAGRISLAVAELPSGDHVRVVVRGGEIEGTGLYEVAVVDDVVREVTVKHGRAQIRLVGQQEVFLATGQVWRAPVVTAEIVKNTSSGISTNSGSTPATNIGSIATTGISPTNNGTANIDSGAPTRLSTATGASAHSPAIAQATTRTPDSANGMSNTSSSAATGISTRSATSTATSPSTTTTTTSTKTPTSAEKPAQPAVPELHTMADASPGEAPPVSVDRIAKAQTKPVNALEQHFAAGWSLLRTGKPADAARELAAAADAGGDDPLAGDARYFEAIALTRAGRKTEAEHALVAFMDRSPHAVRRGRAAVMLGRLIAERGDPATARTWFESAAHDPDPNVVAAANAGLASLK